MKDFGVWSHSTPSDNVLSMFFTMRGHRGQAVRCRLYKTESGFELRLAPLVSEREVIKCQFFAGRDELAIQQAAEDWRRVLLKDGFEDVAGV
jgi:hypothetical protein